jgi:hypothetical protein
MIDNETTQILGGEKQNNQQSQTAPVNNEQQAASTQSQTKESGMGKAAYAAGGFVAGVASTAAVNAMANEKPAEEEPKPVVEEEPQEEVKEEPIKIDPADSPSEQDVIIATDEGIRVAQVDDDKSFSEAFADARAQVGPGGVFEWRGKVYGTFYENEWDQMSAKERAEWQAKVDYDDVRDPNEEQLYAHHQDTHHQEHHQSHTSSAAAQPEKQEQQEEQLQEEQHIEGQQQEEQQIEGQQQEEQLAVNQEPTTPSNQQMVDDTPVDGEIRVIGVEHVVNNGQEMNVALLEHSSGDQALLVDIDDNGQFDVLLHDDNQDGQITENEVYDASGMNASVADLQQAAAEQGGMDYVANNDGMPDYSNDADTSSLI